MLIMFGQAIEREQRRMRSFERFMPAPVDAMLRSRIVDMEKGITSVWTSIGITQLAVRAARPSAFAAAAARIAAFRRESAAAGSLRSNRPPHS